MQLTHKGLRWVSSLHHTPAGAGSSVSHTGSSVSHTGTPIAQTGTSARRPLECASDAGTQHARAVSSHFSLCHWPRRHLPKPRPSQKWPGAQMAVRVSTAATLLWCGTQMAAASTGTTAPTLALQGCFVGTRMPHLRPLCSEAQAWGREYKAL